MSNSPTAQVTIGKNSSLVFLLALIIGAQPIATDLYLPAMPDLARSLPDVVAWGLTLSSTSTLTFFTLFYGLGQVLGGQWVDRFGRRPSLLAALTVYTVAAVGCVLTSDLMVLLALRAVQGMATATIVVMARAAMRDSYSVEDAPRVMSQIFTRLGFVVVLCPLVGAVLATHGGWRASLAAMALYGACLLAWCVWRFEETQPPLKTDTDIAGWQLVKTLWASPSFRHWTLLASVTISGVFTFLTLSSHIFIGMLGFSAYGYGAVLVGGAITFVGSNVLCSRLLKRTSTLQIAKLGVGLSLLAGVLQVAAVLCFDAGTALCLAAFLIAGQYCYALGHGMLQSCALASCTADFPHMAGRASAWSGLIMMVVAFAVSQTATSFVNSQHTNGAWPWALTIALCGIALALLQSSARRVG